MSANPIRRWNPTQIDALWKKEVTGEALSEAESRALRKDRAPKTPDHDEVLRLAFKEIQLLDWRSPWGLLEPMAEACIREMGRIRWAILERSLREKGLLVRRAGVAFPVFHPKAVPPPGLTEKEAEAAKALQWLQSETGAWSVDRRDLLSRLNDHRNVAGRLIQAMVGKGILSLGKGDRVGPGPDWEKTAGPAGFMLARLPPVAGEDQSGG